MQPRGQFRIGIIDYDSSHCVEFTRRLNHAEIEPDQWVDGGRVVVGCPGQSFLSPERLPMFTEQMQTLGIPTVGKPAEMIGSIDGVMILSVDGSVHWNQTRAFLDAGIPCFVDKPFTCGLAEAIAMVRYARQRQVPIYSSSALRYAPELVQFVAQSRAAGSETGTIRGASVYGPAATRPRNPGLFHYGIHSIEALFAILGPECQSVSCLRRGGESGSDEAGVDTITAVWPDDRLATVRGIRSGHREFGFVAYCEKQVRHVTLDTRFVYRELLEQVTQFFETGQSPVDPDETLRILSFIEASHASARAGGVSVQLAAITT